MNDITSWLGIGADFRLRTRYANAGKLDAHAANHDIMRQSYRARFWARAQLADDLTANLRITTEPAYYWRPDLSDQFTKDEALFDQMNLTWKNAFDLPLTAVIGRQDIPLGSGYLIRRGTPLDGSRTNFFDALRLTWEMGTKTTAVSLRGKLKVP